jgi:hypothetical protein
MEAEVISNPSMPTRRPKDSTRSLKSKLTILAQERKRYPNRETTMYTPTYHPDETFAEGFRRIAASLGVPSQLLGARISVAGDKAVGIARDGDPEFWYFRGHVPDRGECSFYLTRTRDETIDRGHPITKAVAWRWMERVLSYPENRHLLHGDQILSRLTDEEVSRRLLEASLETATPDHVRELLAAAATRLAA